MSRMRFTTLLFDVDGTLIDSNGAHAESWTKALQEHDVDVEIDQIRPLIGMGGDKILPAIAHVSEDSARGRSMARRKKDIFNSFLPSLQPTPGTRSLVEYLREQGVDMVIATSADDREMTALLERAGVADLLPARASKDNAPASKPDPDIVQAALARSQARPKYTALIGDRRKTSRPPIAWASKRSPCAVAATGPIAVFVAQSRSSTIRRRCCRTGARAEITRPYAHVDTASKLSTM
jgi:beta-phosphoglucomutase-like phosphatase (HAD superfamily)